MGALMRGNETETLNRAIDNASQQGWHYFYITRDADRVWRRLRRLLEDRAVIYEARKPRVDFLSGGHIEVREP